MRGVRESETMSDVGGVAADQLVKFIMRLERLDEEKKALAEDMKQVMAEAKGQGFDAKIIREVLKLRKMNPADRREQEELLELYLRALSMDAAA